MRALLSLIILGQSLIGLSQSTEKVIITGSRFTYPLINKWIEEFKKTNPEVNFTVIPRGTPNVDSANLIINAHELAPAEIRPGFKVINISRYVLLPVANEKNPALAKYEKKGLDEKELKTLFFKKFDPIADLEAPKKSKGKSEYQPTLYTREQKACAPTTFARSYGFEQEDILGKPIGGDDNHLISAIKKDTNGITFNNLGFIYDIKTRKVNTGLKVIPLDFNNNGKVDEEENIYENLDNLVSVVEGQRSPKVAVGNINLSYPNNVKESNKNLALFLEWVLNEGRQYQHEFGFLDLDKAELNKQKEILLSAVK